MDSYTENTNSQLQSKKKSKKRDRSIAEPEPETDPKKFEPETEPKNFEPETEPEPVQVKVQIIRENPNKTPPFVGYFPSGFDPSNYSGSTSFQAYRNQKMTKRLELVVKPAGASVDFVGTNYSGEATVGSRARYALGVFDKDAQTLKIVPIAGNKIFRLEPKIKGEVIEREPAISTVEERTPYEKAMISQQLFGTKKANEKAKKREALRQDEDPDSLKNLELKMQNVLVNKKALECTESHVTRNIPPYNASATTPQEAYVLDQIILKGEWDHLEDIYNILQQGEAANFSSYPTFVQTRIEKLKKIEDESEKKKRSCIFSYINHLIKFKDQHSMDRGASSKNHKFPNILRHKFTTMFDVSDTKRLPEEKIDLLNSYVLVLTLFIDDFQTDYIDITKDLGMNSSKVKDLYVHLGCKFKRPEKKEFGKRFCATLPVPLQFPELRIRKSRR